MFRKIKEKRKIKKEALKFQDKINRLGYLFKTYGFDVQYKGSLYINSKNRQFYLRFKDDSSGETVSLIKELSKELNTIEEYYYGLQGKFFQEVILNKNDKKKIDYFRWTYSYNCHNLTSKLRTLNSDINNMERIVFVNKK